MPWRSSLLPLIDIAPTGVSKSEIINANLADAGRGTISTAVTIAAAITAHMEQVEYGLRCLLHMTGILVGAVTIWSIVRRSRGN